MTNFKTTFITREATEIRIAEIEKEIKKTNDEFAGTIYEATALKMIDNLDMMKCKLEADLKHFDEIEKAIA